MKQFKDDNGNTWTLKADTNAIVRIQQLADVDLTKLLEDNEVINQAIGSNVKFVQVLYAWLQPGIEAKELSPEDFGGALYESLPAAFDAFLGELPNFSPPHRRELAEQLVAKYLATEQVGQSRATDVMNGERSDATIKAAMYHAEDQAFDAIAKQIGLPGSTNSEES